MLRCLCGCPTRCPWPLSNFQSPSHRRCRQARASLLHPNWPSPSALDRDEAGVTIFLIEARSAYRQPLSRQDVDQPFRAVTFAFAGCNLYRTLPRPTPKSALAAAHATEFYPPTKRRSHSSLRAGVLQNRQRQQERSHTRFSPATRSPWLAAPPTLCSLHPTRPP